jgi:hypothetical protein
MFRKRAISFMYGPLFWLITGLIAFALVLGIYFIFSGKLEGVIDYIKSIMRFG